MNKVLEATDDKYKIRQDVVTLAECREQIKLHANNIASDITNTFVNKNRILHYGHYLIHLKYLMLI